MAGKLKDGSKFEAVVPAASTTAGGVILQELNASGARYEVANPASSQLTGMLSTVFFPLLVIAIIYFLVLGPVQTSLRR